MKEGGSLIVIFLLICIESCSSLDYENICKHHFSQGCPVHESESWRCAKVLTNCSGDQLNRYHCVLNSTGQAFKVIHTCAPLLQCVKGTIPIYDERKKAISCKTCPEGYYQPLNTWSDETPECLERHTCEKEGNKIECDMGTGLSNTKDVHCRCDARNSYILMNFEIRGKCVEWAHATCYLHPCPDGQERLLNYSCAALCPQGQKRDDNDICIPISLVNPTTSSLNDSLIISGETTPKTTTVTSTSTSTSIPTTSDSNIPTIIASVIAGVVVLILVVLFTLFWRFYLSKKYQCVMNTFRTRRQSQTEVATELERMGINQGIDADVTAGNNPSQGERTDEGKPMIIVYKPKMVQIGDKNRNTYNHTAEVQKTSDDSSSTHSSGSSLADSSHLPNSTQGTGADVAAGINSSQGERTGEGRTINHQKICVNADVVQFGNKNKVNKYNFSAEQQNTSDGSSSNCSRRGSDSSLADSPHLPNSSQGELPVNSNLSSQRNSSEDIELDTQPKQISNGRDIERHASFDRHADNEQTYRKVA